VVIGTLGQHELAEALELSTGSVTAMVDRLERRGYVERRVDPNDRRRSVVGFSTSGDNALRDVQDWMKQIFASHSPTDLRQIAEILTVLTQGLRELIESVPEPEAERPDGRLRRRSR
jgi:DNA-binding MarR family transcriptional regulator